MSANNSAAEATQSTAKIALVGSPNSGKSLLFNGLTGLNHKVANFPGITVSLASGRWREDEAIELVDYPGVYSLHSLSGEEAVAVDAFDKALNDPSHSAVICVLDASRLEKGLFLALQVADACRKHNKPLVFAANMFDVLERNGLRFDFAGLAAAVGVPVVPISAKTGEGLEQLMATAKSAKVPTMVQADDALIATDSGSHTRRAHELAKQYGPQGELLVRSQTRLDQFFLHSLGGGLAFFAIMLVLFQSIFTWAAPAMDAVEAAIVAIEELVVPALGDGFAASFASNAIFGGLGAFLVFVPQIFVLTLIVNLLEDSGYLARAALICHRPLQVFGLTGKSFVPMLSGVACAIPGIYAARTVDSPYKRWLTYMAVPLMPCSARLPVYGLLIAAFIPDTMLFGGLIGYQGLAMFGIYVFGIVMALLVTAMVSSAQKDRSDDLPFVLEMPPYRRPGLRPTVRNAWDRSKHFVIKAGPIIFSVTAVIWLLGYFPNQGEDLANSWMGSIGRFIQPVFEPLGLDWKYGVAIITSFLAREVFVGTMGTLFGLENAEEDIISLAEHVQASGLPLGSGIALLVFFAIALQCVSTMAILSREAGGWKLPLQMFVGYFILAYGLAWLAMQAVSLLT